MVEATVLTSNGVHEASTPSARPLRLLVLVPKPPGVSPGQRFRLEQWAPRVAQTDGITLDFLPFESPALTKVLYQPGRLAAKGLLVTGDFLRRARALVTARKYDGVVVYREAALLGPAIYERLFRWTGVPLVFDFDDSIWLPGQTGVNGIFSKLHFWGKTATTCRIASGVIAGNGYLADYARQFNDNVFVVPTSIELDRYPVIGDPDEETFIVGWSGSLSTLQHFEHARPALEKLAKRRKLVVHVVCNKPPDNPIAGAENRFTKWTEAGESAAIGAAHAGIMPLPDDTYTRGKCGLKALQYMATGRPVVISPVGMNADLIQSGENGFLATTADDFVDALETLAGSRDLRRRIGAAARATVESGYSGEAVSKVFAKAIRSTLSST